MSFDANGEPLIWGVPTGRFPSPDCMNLDDRLSYAETSSRESSDVPQERGTPCWKFADAQFDERSLELTVAGAVVELERKPLEVLRVLLQRAGEVVTHDELL